MKKRAMRKRIPYGIYCNGYDRNGNMAGCPWFRWDAQAQAHRCTFLRMTSDGATDLLWDGCKECSVHEDADGRIERRIQRRKSGRKSVIGSRDQSGDLSSESA